MATVTLSIPDDLLKRAVARLGQMGQVDLEEYLLSVVEVLSLERQPLDRETEAKLLEGLDSPLERMSDEDWKALRDRVKSRPTSK